MVNFFPYDRYDFDLEIVDQLYGRQTENYGATYL